MIPLTLRGGPFRTAPEVWQNLPPPDQDRRGEYMRRYARRWRRLHPGYSSKMNKEWYRKNFSKRS